jgi:site-specific recombinase XerD
MAGVRNRKRYWQIWWYVDRERYWCRLSKVDYPKRKDALKEAFKRELEAKDYIRPDVSFKQYAYSFLSERQLSTVSFEKYDKFIRSFDEFLCKRSVITLKQITETTISDYVIYKQRTHKPASINRDIVYLKLILRSAFERGIISRMPLNVIKSLKIEKQIKILPTREEREQILKWFGKNEPLFYAWIYFEITRGWRKDELRKMKISDVDLQGNILYIKNTKTKEQRLEKLTEQDCLVLNEHLLFLKKIKRYNPAGFLFPSKDGGLIGKNTILRKIKRACRELGITKNITNHLFRHYVVTSILDSTANIEVVKAITGHKDTKTILQHYAHATSENVKKGLEITKVNTELGSIILKDKVNRHGREIR